MKPIEGWIGIKIRDIVALSVPGEWGIDSTCEEGIPVLRSTNFRNNGTIDFNDLAYRKVEERRLDKRRISNGTILIEKSGGGPSQPAGRVVYCDCDFGGTASNFIEIVKVKDAFSPQFVAFLLYYLYQTGLVLKYQQQTTGIINFKLNEYWEERVNCPASKPEQAKIAEILSTVDRAIEQTEALIAKEQRIKIGLMQDLLTRGIDEQGNLRSEETHEFKDSPLGRIPVEWEIKTIGELAVYVGSGLTPRGGESVYTKEGILFIRSQNVHLGGLELTDVAYIPYQIHDYMRRSEVFQNDVLLNITGASIGRCCYMPAMNCLANVNQHVCAIRLRQPTKANAGFMTAVLESNIGQNQILQFNAGGNREGLNYQQVRSFIVPWPTAPERQRTHNLIEVCSKAVKEYGRNLQKLNPLKTALMQDLLTGKVRVTSL